jgi:hypothetical protein
VAFATVAGTNAFVALGSGVLGAITLGLAVALSSSIVVVNITRSRKRTADLGSLLLGAAHVIAMLPLPLPFALPSGGGS